MYTSGLGYSVLHPTLRFLRKRLHRWTICSRSYTTTVHKREQIIMDKFNAN